MQSSRRRTIYLNFKPTTGIDSRDTPRKTNLNCAEWGSVNHNSPEHCSPDMEMEQWIAIFFTVLMVGSVIAMGATLL